MGELLEGRMAGAKSAGAITGEAAVHQAKDMTAYEGVAVQLGGKVRAERGLNMNS